MRREHVVRDDDSAKVGSAYSYSIARFAGSHLRLTWLERFPLGRPNVFHIVYVGNGGRDLLRQTAGSARTQGVAVHLTVSA